MLFCIVSVAPKWPGDEAPICRCPSRGIRLLTWLFELRETHASCRFAGGGVCLAYQRHCDDPVTGIESRSKTSCPPKHGLVIGWRLGTMFMIEPFHAKSLRRTRSVAAKAIIAKPSPPCAACSGQRSLHIRLGATLVSCYNQVVN